jgi:hypothetical protein
MGLKSFKKVRIGITVLLTALIINLETMGRVILLNFNNRDKTVKLKLDDDDHISTASQAVDYLVTKLNDSSKYSFEFLDASGRFVSMKNETLLIWETNFMKVLVVDSTLDSSPVLSIRGRAFDSSNGLTIATEGNQTSAILIKERQQASLGTGLITWDATIVLAKYLESHPYLVRLVKLVLVWLL